MPESDSERVRLAIPDTEGTPTFSWALTTPELSDNVQLALKPCYLPVIFVPGIMGSNLRSKLNGKPVWRYDSSLGLMCSMAFKSAGDRQQILNPFLVDVDPNGFLPLYLVDYKQEDGGRERGWGSVGGSCYLDFLIWMEQHLNQVSPNPAKWRDFYQVEPTIEAKSNHKFGPKLSPGVKMGIVGQPFPAHKSFQSLTTDDLLARSRFNMPVYAFGYNWLDSCKNAGSALKEFIDKLIQRYDTDPFWCRQVVLVTHSMGGLVARYCATLPGMSNKIAGVVHGVMPTIGAAVAYRRCKVGMLDEGSGLIAYGTALTIGSNGREVTAVFSQAPGALQLLPSPDYAAGWLKVQPEGQAATQWPVADPYEEIYRRSDTWWGLVREDWLSPAGGTPISWAVFQMNVDKAEAFHRSIKRKYHSFSYVIYGNDPDQKSFETVTWKMSKGFAPDAADRPSVEQVVAMKQSQVRQDGSATAYVGGQREVLPGEVPVVFETSYWELHCESQDGRGDGTVPASSGRTPFHDGGASIQQQFAMPGFDHQGAFNNEQVRKASLYSIIKIAAAAKKP